MGNAYMAKEKLCGSSSVTAVGMLSPQPLPNKSRAAASAPAQRSPAASGRTEAPGRGSRGGAPGPHRPRSGPAPARTPARPSRDLCSASAPRQPPAPPAARAPSQPGPAQPGTRPRALQPAPARYLGRRTGSGGAASQRPRAPLASASAPRTPRRPRPCCACAPATAPPRPGGRTTAPRAARGRCRPIRAAGGLGGSGPGVPWAALGGRRARRESRAGHGRGGAAAARGGARGLARRPAPQGARRERGVAAAGAARRRHAGAAGGGGAADRRCRLLAGEDPGGDVGRVGPGGGAGHEVLGERPVPQDVAGPAEGGLRVPEAQRLTRPCPPSRPPGPHCGGAPRGRCRGDLTWSFVFPPTSSNTWGALVWTFYVSLPKEKKTLFKESVLAFRFFVEAQAILYSHFYLFRVSVVDTKLVCVLRSELITCREVIKNCQPSFLRAVTSRNPARKTSINFSFLLHTLFLYVEYGIMRQVVAYL